MYIHVHIHVYTFMMAGEKEGGGNTGGDGGTIKGEEMTQFMMAGAR